MSSMASAIGSGPVAPSSRTHGLIDFHWQQGGDLCGGRRDEAWQRQVGQGRQQRDGPTETQHEDRSILLTIHLSQGERPHELDKIASGAAHP